jgi:hypothetical protein
MPPIPPHRPRIVVYYQTHHDAQGNHISVLPLVTGGTAAVTHLILAAVHLNEEPGHITLNDHVPSHARFTTLWAELRLLQASGIKVMGLLGGAAPGTYAVLSGDAAAFERYYAPLRDMVRERGLDGLDLDVEETMSLPAIVRLIDRLRSDFGRGFIISLAPVAAAMIDPTKNLSGFDYAELETARGTEIAFYNTQFYCGWGSCHDTAMFGMVMARGWNPEKIVIGLVTNPENGGGFVPLEQLALVLMTLRGHYGVRFGGVMGWEYFNSLPGGRERPWEWASWMTALVGGPPATPHSPVASVPAPMEMAMAMAKTDQSDQMAPLPRDFEYFSDAE